MRKFRSKIQWLWGFTKFIVCTIALLYFTHVIYTETIMAITGDLSALPSLIDATAQVFTVCVGGYLIKATVENVFKYNKKSQNNEEEDCL